MFSIIFAVMGCVVGVFLATVSLVRVAVARRHWEAGASAAPAVVRWLWAATVACLALTSVMMAVMAMAVIVARGHEAGMEGSLASRVAVYIGALAYLTAWLRGKLKVKWPSFSRSGPKLLPPMPEQSEAPETEPSPNPLGSTEL